MADLLGIEPDEALASRLRLAVMRLARRLRQQTSDPISASQISALFVIERRQPITLGDLARAERVAAPTMTRIVTALESQGLVVRAVDEGDRRVARLSITGAGKRVLERSRSRKTAYIAARMRTLTPQERATLAAAADLLERLAEDGR